MNSNIDINDVDFCSLVIGFVWCLMARCISLNRSKEVLSGKCAASWRMPGRKSGDEECL